MRPSITLLSCLSLWLAASSAFAATPDLSGSWEIQSLGSDRQVTIQQKGKKIVAHRVLWPEFEGERYKLEHLYRGTIGADGTLIHGQLLVKEDELPDWEVLRGFTGKINAADDMVIDGLPIKRTGAAGGAPPDAGPTGRDNPPPSMAQGPAQADAAATVAAAPAQPAPPRPPPATEEAAPADGSASLFASIMGAPGTSDLNLFRVSNRVTIPNPVADLTEEGDALFAKKRYKEALTRYQKATEVANKTHAELIHRMGRCYLRLGQLPQAKELLAKALRLDPYNERLERDYLAAKRGS